MEMGPGRRRSLSVPRPGPAHPSPGPPLLRSARRRAGRRRGSRPQSAPVRWAPPSCPRSACRANTASRRASQSAFKVACAQPPRRGHRNRARKPLAQRGGPAAPGAGDRVRRGGGVRGGAGAVPGKRQSLRLRFGSRARRVLGPGLRWGQRPGCCPRPWALFCGPSPAGEIHGEPPASSSRRAACCGRCAAAVPWTRAAAEAKSVL